MPFHLKPQDAYQISLWAIFWGLIGWLWWNAFTGK